MSPNTPQALTETAELDLEGRKQELFSRTSGDRFFSHEPDHQKALERDIAVGDLLSADNYALFNSLAEVPYDTLDGGKEALIPLENGCFLNFRSYGRVVDGLQKPIGGYEKYMIWPFDDDDQQEWIEKARSELVQAEESRKALKAIARKLITSPEYTATGLRSDEIADLLRQDSSLYGELRDASQSFTIENHGYDYVDLGNGVWLEISGWGEDCYLLKPEEARNRIASAQDYEKTEMEHARRQDREEERSASKGEEKLERSESPYAAAVRIQKESRKATKKNLEEGKGN